VSSTENHRPMSIVCRTAGGSGSGAEQARTAEEAFAAKASARSYMPHGWRVSVNSAPEGKPAGF